MNKLVIGTPEWFGRVFWTVRKLVVDNKDQIDGVSYSLCETYRNVPEHLNPDSDGTLSWYLNISDGTVVFGCDALESADFRVSVEYEIAEELGKLDTRVEGGKAAFEAKVMEYIKAGRASMVGASKARPDFLEDLHNLIAEFTA